MTRTINGHEWTRSYCGSNGQIFHSRWWMSDGDAAYVEIDPDYSVIYIYCFSGSLGSYVVISSTEYTDILRKSGLSGDDRAGLYEQGLQIVCLRVADFVCSQWCEYKP